MSTKDYLEKDYYKALGVAKTAKPAEIKTAYRKLARKYHPAAGRGTAGSTSTSATSSAGPGTRAAAWATCSAPCSTAAATGTRPRTGPAVARQSRTRGSRDSATRSTAPRPACG